MSSLLEVTLDHAVCSPNPDNIITFDITLADVGGALLQCLPQKLQLWTSYAGSLLLSPWSWSARPEAVQLSQTALRQRKTASELLSPTQPVRQQLATSVDWLAQVEADDYNKVLVAADMAPGSGLFPADHLFCALMKAGNVQDAMVWARQPDATGASTAGLTPPQSPAVTSPCAEAAGGDPPAAPSPQFEVLVAYLLGEEVCGHAGIVHGGLTAAMIDESFGYLLYLARRAKILQFKAVLTASLEVQYKQPLPSRTAVCISARISRVDGRKVWVTAELADSPETRAEGLREADAAASPAKRVVFASAQALFIAPRPSGASTAALAAAGPPVDFGTPTDV